MEFRIADTFTDSLAKLADQEQKAVKTTAFDLQVNPTSPGMRFHKLDKPRDKNFWSIRVNNDIRLIVHKTDTSLLLCYVGHHNDAYRWAERRKLQTHPKTGAAQLVEVRETIQEVVVPRYIDVEQPAPPKPALFAAVDDDTLLSYGVPPEWMDDVRQADEDTVLELTDRLPAEAAEALLELATGGTPGVPEPVIADTDPFEHPDAQRRFRVMANIEELQRALDYPWEKWTVFLHPAQQDLVERQYGGPARVSGSAGTGKTVVALHRAVFLAKTYSDARVLLTTFSDTLADALRWKLRMLVGNEPRLFERIEIHSVEDVGRRLHASCIKEPRLVDDTTLHEMLREASRDAGEHRFSDHFLWTEWNEVVDAWQLDGWEAYRDVARLGRKTRLGEKQRQLLWGIFEQVRRALAEKGLLTTAMMFAGIADHLKAKKARPYQFAVVDEAQDVGVPQLRFLAALAGSNPDGLFLAGDLGQRIFQPPFSWRSLGVDVRGRSHTLRVNYRTSHQIRQQADRLLPPELADVDGNTESRRGTVSVFNGPDPVINVCRDERDEATTVAAWVSQHRAEGLQPHEVGVFVRSASQLSRARAAIEAAGLEPLELSEHFDSQSGHVSICTMHLAKGLEFRAVVVMACDDEVIPLQERIEVVADDADLEEVYNTERHLLYVACTRARDHLLVTGVEPASEFLDDLCG
ncbi:3'-5' exonuclease [Anaerobaca lacustris]|uniref:DNA 3'-5' helicase n=1 Tax=Anaerobaca lacustris TaxID=3044600 RepID=A0AAW6U1J1_9BACT|nr:3'-5' exonuclease [Sedimentisphaerales bacterium M17dextr]